MIEVIFLLVLGLIWIMAASLEDLKKREVANWISFSLIAFALGFRFFYSLFSGGDFAFFYQGLIGLGIFFILGNLLYYMRMFAGGDAKLMIALGTILPLSTSFLENVRIFSLFFIIFLVVGMFYGIFWSSFLAIKHSKEFKKEFSKRITKNKKFIYSIMLIGLVFMILGFFENLFLFTGILIFIFPFFYIYAKSVDEACMIRKINTNKLTEGDWLYKDVKTGRKPIKASWDGLDKKEISLIRKKHKSVLIRQGIPFIPVFLISFLILIWWWFLR